MARIWSSFPKSPPTRMSHLKGTFTKIVLLCLGSIGAAAHAHGNSTMHRHANNRAGRPMCAHLLAFKFLPASVLGN
ncbi:hypothetical protein BC826DRAFT_1038490 [Russula brevipes]|nr:hypothetical protein BC826DRAFT_1038490 [Russula brevipes]